MKTLITKSKSSFILALSVIAMPIWAKPAAQVTELKGNVFITSESGATKALKLNDHVDDRAELLVDENGAITLNNYFNVTYHLTSGSHMKVYEKSVQLKKGKAWIQSSTARHNLMLTTANAHVEFKKGEFIATFDQHSAKTQVLVVNGDVELANVLDPNMRHNLNAGTFSVIDPEVEEGHPRVPTRVGLGSLNQALAEFKALPESLKKESPREATRAIASVEEVSVPTKGKIIFIGHANKIERMPASVKTAPVAKKHDLSHAPIHYYGMSKNEVDSPRTPASVVKTNEVQIDSQFEQNLILSKESPVKYSKELDNLIEDLKSY